MKIFNKVLWVIWSLCFVEVTCVQLFRHVQYSYQIRTRATPPSQTYNPWQTPQYTQHLKVSVFKYIHCHCQILCFNFDKNTQTKQSDSTIFIQLSVSMIDNLYTIQFSVRASDFQGDCHLPAETVIKYRVYSNSHSLLHSHFLSDPFYTTEPCVIYFL